MCGICGYLNFDEGCEARPAIVAAMCATLAHRGPDDQGVWTRGAVALGHRRLSIIDLDGGHQPMGNEDGSVWVTCNGEVYDFQELATQLRAEGHHFTTRSDTEVLVHLYEREGLEFLDRLNGMFALAIWDDRRKRLILARDRMGQKPLYWCVFRGSFIFASELKGLLAHPAVPRDLDLGSLSRYLALQAIPAPYSIFKGIHKLESAHYLIVENGAVKSRSYWEYSLGVEQQRVCILGLQEQLRDLLRTAVRRRLVSDVPLGVFVSGGIDSSAIAALACDTDHTGIKSFSIGFDNPMFDESDYARTMARHVGTDHYNEVMSPSAGLEIVETLGPLLDEPFADASVIPTYCLSRFTREHVTVALSGDGADELLAGYPAYLAHRYAALGDHLPGFLRRRGLPALLNWVPASWDRVKAVERARKFAAALALEPGVNRHYAWRGSFAPARQPELFTADAWRAISGDMAYDRVRHYESCCAARDLIERMLYVDARLYMQDDVLAKVDRASMAVGLEVRSPFLDVDVVEFLAGVPLRYKLNGRTTKYLLKRVVRDLVPDTIIRRPKKGFASPVAQWLRTDFRPMAEDLLSADRLNRAGLFRPAYVRTLLDEHCTGRRDNHKYLWPLLMFELWRDHYMRGHEGVRARPARER